MRPLLPSSCKTSSDSGISHIEEQWPDFQVVLLLTLYPNSKENDSEDAYEVQDPER